ncbi:hypothetical protein DWY73_05215 [Bacteroides fragilis]|uniref:Uncharacterized protein n=2 Tax=Bacteroides fragilis TaxID=817 RepID=Q64RL7_BACFR|nr:hypothetical protein F3B26_03670 [Bacteroides fragilis]BAD49864.1 hypothetical protein BF3119 [Bacteroides fragilis YCH46]KAA4775496.1 hypothetical protein F2841_07690 [Bacteroides fragilis]KAA4781329.1 hypothetical protein F3B22_07345 [Bacteroides fragilis]KAA4789899.1 hypothetical protein F3B21_12760 [Bacteroides fragilis]
MSVFCLQETSFLQTKDYMDNSSKQNIHREKHLVFSFTHRYILNITFGRHPLGSTVIPDTLKAYTDIMSAIQTRHI